MYTASQQMNVLWLWKNCAQLYSTGQLTTDTSAAEVQLQVMCDWTQLTCISGSLRAWGHAAAGTPWLFVKLQFSVKGQPYVFK